ncbi:DUF4405 domain-containing protein [Pectinatus haikarae]|uniref:DUF4405 domain-containing protein n=1 Tax=Pectinatus haikarae TaxID=349096 RepID=UPI0018C49925|nr:DUF4405 domain-containing protein [Pectinatus haikarae]
MKRNILNIGMTIVFLLVMNYRFTGNKPHEVLGVILFLLVLWHNSLNLHWYTSFFKGKQDFQRALIAIINFLFAISFCISMLSGLLISQSIVPFIALRGTNTLWLHEVHQSSSYVCFIFIGIHLGLHWKMLWVRLQNRLGMERFHKECSILGNILAVGIILYGFYASFANHIWSMIVMEHGFGWGPPPSALKFFLDYSALLGCYAGITHYAVSLLSKKNPKLK